MNNLVENLQRHAREQPKSVAIWSDKTQLTYSELFEAVSRTAGWLSEAIVNNINTAHDDAKTTPNKSIRIGVYGNRSVNSLVAIYACAWAGCTYVPLGAKLPPDRLNSFVGRANLHGLLVADDFEKSKTLQHIPPEVLDISQIVANDYEPQPVPTSTVTNISPLHNPVKVDPDSLAYIMFTSGTTGTPKGVMLTNGNVFSFLDFFIPRCNVQPVDRVCQLCEFTFDLSVPDIFQTIHAGACLYIVPEKHRMAPGAFIRKHKITNWCSVPSTLALMDRFNQLAPNAYPELRLSWFCGEPLPVHLIMKWREAAPNMIVDNHYGPTEATVACLAQYCTGLADQTNGRHWATIGKPYPQMKVACVDETLTFLSAGNTGQLVLSGPQTAPGYWQDTEKTNAQFVELVHPQDGSETWYLTGDLGIEDDIGNFHFLGRMDNQVKVRGHRIELEDIEANLRAICDCEHAACVAWPNNNGVAEGLVAFVAAGSLSKSEILKELTNRVPVYMIPDTLYIAENIPLTVNGKLDRNSIVEHLENNDLTALQLSSDT